MRVVWTWRLFSGKSFQTFLNKVKLHPWSDWNISDNPTLEKYLINSLTKFLVSILLSVTASGKLIDKHDIQQIIISSLNFWQKSYIVNYDFTKRLANSWNRFQWSWVNNPIKFSYFLTSWSTTKFGTIFNNTKLIKMHHEPTSLPYS